MLHAERRLSARRPGTGVVSPSLGSSPPHGAKESERTDLPSKAKSQDGAAELTPNARKRAPRMTPLQTSSDPEVADWEKPLGASVSRGAASFRPLGPPERRRPRRRLGPASFRAPIPGGVRGLEAPVHFPSNTFPPTRLSGNAEEWAIGNPSLRLGACAAEINLLRKRRSGPSSCNRRPRTAPLGSASTATRPGCRNRLQPNPPGAWGHQRRRHDCEAAGIGQGHRRESAPGPVMPVDGKIGLVPAEGDIGPVPILEGGEPGQLRPPSPSPQEQDAPNPSGC